jgi:predicted HAD superfamily Cof-like phosphohydrolase
MSELDELACTVSDNEQDKDKLMEEALITRDKCSRFYDNQFEVVKDDQIADQYDALVDIWYYSLNISAKHGANLSKIFDRVHEANLKKRDPKTGEYIRRESDGKVMKPVGWKSPDITEEISKQFVKLVIKEDYRTLLFIPDILFLTLFLILF